MEENNEYISERGKNYKKTHKEQIAASLRRWKQENRERVALYEKQRRDKKRMLPRVFQQDQWDECKKFFNFSCAYCGQKQDNLTRDHFVPLSDGGAYVQSNILPSCFSCNSSKKDNNFFKWYPNQPFYSKERANKILEYLNLGYENNVCPECQEG